MPPKQAGMCLAFLIGNMAVALSQDSLLNLVDATASSGLAFEHQDGTGKSYLFELMGAGLATLDYDNDGRCDIYFLNGGVVPDGRLGNDSLDAQRAGQGRGNALWKLTPGSRVTSHLQFCDVSQAAGLDDRGFGLGVASADYDNDGFTDVYITNFGANKLFHNNGDGTFADVTQSAHVADGEKFGAGAVFVDIDADGDLDLFSGNYVKFSLERHAQLAPVAFPFPPGPKDFPPEPDTLFRNEGNGTFVDISRVSGIADTVGPSMGVVASDFDLDGNQDIFVCSDGAPDHLLVGDGSGNFVDEGFFSGVAYDARGNANGSMGADVGDLNGDGLEDLFVTDYANQFPMLFMSQEPGLFQDETRARNAGRELLPHVNWGVGLVDLDNDGDLDAFVANGHFLKDTRATHPQTKFSVVNTLLENTGRAEFREVAAAGKMDWGVPASSRGTAFEDFDNDGDVDIVILNCAAAAQLLENRSAGKNHWLRIELVGRRANRTAVGASVSVSSPGFELSAQVHSGRGYQSDYGKVLHFGLGQLSSVSNVKIVWPGGEVQQLAEVAADQQLTIIQPH